ncbi:hypothetical protein UK99_22100, partial [Frankia casuarinae]
MTRAAPGERLTGRRPFGPCWKPRPVGGGAVVDSGSDLYEHTFEYGSTGVPGGCVVSVTEISRGSGG